MNQRAVAFGHETAATAITVGPTSALIPPFWLIVDPPFIFVVRDTGTGQILFIGRALNPVIRRESKRPSAWGAGGMLLACWKLSFYLAQPDWQGSEKLAHDPARSLNEELIRAVGLTPCISNQVADAS